MFWYGPHMGGWGWALGSLLFWALVAVAIIALVRYFTRGGQRPLPPYRGYAGGTGPDGPPGTAPGQAPAAAEQILSERFARGEIDEEEYRRRLATLRSG